MLITSSGRTPSSSYIAKTKEACSKNNAKFFEINDDYEEEMKELYGWIDEQIKSLKYQSINNIEK